MSNFAHKSVRLWKEPKIAYGSLMLTNIFKSRNLGSTAPFPHEERHWNFLSCNVSRLYCTSVPVKPKTGSQESSPASSATLNPAIRKIVVPHDPKQYRKHPHSEEPNDNEPHLTEYMMVEAKKNKTRPMTFQQKVQETASTAGYCAIMLFGFAVLVSCGYSMYLEMFSRNSVNYIYDKTVSILKKDTRIQDLLGTPLLAHGEETSRGWRRHVLSSQFHDNGVLYIRVRFFLKGPFRKAQVNLEKKADQKGNFTTYNYIIVETEGYPRERIEIDVESL